MDIAFTLKAPETSPVFIGGAGRARTELGRSNVGRGGRPGQPLSLLLLKLMGDGLYRERFEDVFGGGREEGKDGEGTVLLILFEPATEAAG